MTKTIAIAEVNQWASTGDIENFSMKEAVIFYKEFADMIPDTYFELIKENIYKTKEKKEIILSELFMN